MPRYHAAVVERYAATFIFARAAGVIDFASTCGDVYSVYA
jgi:hypothetical protein